MAQTENSAHIADDWYLVANRNNLTIKIVKYITLGESEAGMLVLDSRVEAERWLTLEVDPVGCLNVVYQDPRCRLTCPDRWVADSAGAVLPRCTMLELPNNKVYVSQQLQRGAVEQQVIVTCHNPTELEVANHFQLPPVSEPEFLNDEDVNDAVVADEDVIDIGPDLRADVSVQAQAANASGEPAALADTDPALKDVVMTPEVLDAMLRELEGEEGEEREADQTQDDIVVPEVEAEVQPALRLDNDQIPLLQDIAEVYAFTESTEATPTSANKPHAFELVSQAGMAANQSDQPVAEPDVRPAVESVYARPGRSRSGRQFAIALVVVLVIAVAGFVLINTNTATTLEATQAKASPFVEAPARLPLQTLSEQPVADKSADAPATVQSAATTAQSDVGASETAQLTAAEPTTEPAIDAVPATLSAPGPILAPVVTVDDQPVSDEPVGQDSVSSAIPPSQTVTADIDALLVRAEELLQAGYINWGEPNAVQVIREIFAVDPSHTQALTLLNRAAAMLVAQAERAHADGFEQSALEVVTSVLAFHPEYSPALEKIADWQPTTP